MKSIFILAVLVLLSGCYPGINGKVVDGVNGNPLEGALVLAQWTMTSGLPGLTHHSVYKIEETETNKEGKFSISGVYNPFVDPPAMVIYKKGFVPWRNDRNFMNPTWEQYDEIIWKNDMTYRLEVWKAGYSKMRLSDFVGVGFMTFEADTKIIPQFNRIQIDLRNDARGEIDKIWEKNKKR